MHPPEIQLRSYAAMLESGRHSAEVVTVLVLDLLSGEDDWAGLWGRATPSLRECVRAHLAEVGPDGLPPVFGLGPAGPATPVDDARRREICERLAAGA